jgi:hypothetical protein
MAEPVEGALLGAKFQIIVGGTKSERKAFTVRIASSWLKHHQLKEDDEQLSSDEQNEHHLNSADGELPRRLQDLDRFVYRAGAPYDGLNDRDIKAFCDLKYDAVRAISFTRNNTIYYVVALSKSEGVFTEAEDLYLLWLKRVLELDYAMHPTDTLGNGEQE